MRGEDHRAGDAHALALAAAELVRVAPLQLCRQSDAREHRGHPGGALGAGQRRLVHAQTLGHDITDAHARIQAPQGVLEDDLQVATLRPQVLAREFIQVLAHPHDAPG